MVTREQLSENRVFGRTRPEYKESAKIALSEGLITDFSDSLGGGREAFCLITKSPESRGDSLNTGMRLVDQPESSTKIRRRPIVTTGSTKATIRP